MNAGIQANLSNLIRQRLMLSGSEPLFVGLCGAQGSGKSTVAESLRKSLSQAGIAAVTISLDDLYLTRAEREQLSRTVHPLFITRGPPGTHDLPLGMAIFESLKLGHPTEIPRFDKSTDDRAPRSQWTTVTDQVQVVLFEGWCVGASPQFDSELVHPVNQLERIEDLDGVWRRYANEMLRTVYSDLFSQLDMLAFVAAPDFEVVRTWRQQQEEDLERRSVDLAQPPHAIMLPLEIARFIQFYERITRHTLKEMPGRANVTYFLDRTRHVTHIRDLANQD